MRAITALVLTFLLLGSAGASDKKFESKDGKYAVGFPGEPKVETKTSGDLVTQTAVVESKGVTFFVISTALPGDPAKALKPEELLESSEKGLMKSFRAKVTESKATTFGKDKLPARQTQAEIPLDASTLHLRLQMVAGNGRMYQVLAIGSKDSVNGVASDKFFESFELRK